MNEKIGVGNLGLSIEMHGYLSDLINNAGPDNDNPFQSIMEAFRFAFSLGFINNKTQKVKSPAQTVSARGFVAKDYEVLIGLECAEKGKTLGGLISEYAEAGCRIMSEHQTAGGLILDLLSVEP